MKNFMIFNLIGEVNPGLEEDISSFINKALLTPEVPVLIAINSPGGITDIGFSIYNKLRALPNPVYTLITGCASSIANIIFLAAPFERRFAFENTTFFVHTASVTFHKETKLLPAELKEEIKELSEINSINFNIISGETNIPTDELEQIFLKQDGESKIYWRDFEQYKIANIITKYDEILYYYILQID